MKSQFLEAVHQGRNGLGRYLLSLLIIVGASLAGVMLSMAGLAFYSLLLDAEIPVLDENFMSDEFFNSYPAIGFWVTGLMLVAIICALFFVEEKVHHRPPYGLLSTTGSLSFKQIRVAFCITLGLNAISSLIRFVILPDAYSWGGELQTWLELLPSKVVALVLISIFIQLLLVCLIRGLFLVFPKPLFIAIIVPILLSFLSGTGNTGTVFIYSFIGSFSEILLLILLIIKTDSVGLSLAWFTARSIYRVFVETAFSDSWAASSLFVGDFLLLTTPIMLLVGTVLNLASIGFFYYWFVGRFAHDSQHST